MLARDGELPEFFERRIWCRPAGAVLATGVFALLIANLLDVTEIAVIASAGFLLIFTAVNLSAWKLSGETRSSTGLSILSTLTSGAALIALLLHASGESPVAFTLIVASWGACLVGELLYQRVSGRKFSLGDSPRGLGGRLES